MINKIELASHFIWCCKFLTATIFMEISKFNLVATIVEQTFLDYIYFFSKEIVTQTSYEKEKTDIFTTLSNNKLEWLNSLNDHNRLLQKKRISIVITGNSIATGLR